jgi:hypothetical protein
MLVNKDHHNDHAVKVLFADSEAKRNRIVRMCLAAGTCGPRAEATRSGGTVKRSSKP